MLCYVHPDCGGSSGVMADAATPKVSKQPWDQGGRCPTRRSIGITTWSLVQRCLSREQGSHSFDSQFGFRASKWLAPVLQPWVWATKLESTPPSHPASVVGSRGRGQPWGLGTSQTQLSFVVSQPAGRGYPRLRRQKGAVSRWSCSPKPYRGRNEGSGRGAGSPGCSCSRAQTLLISRPVHAPGGGHLGPGLA